MHNGDLKKHFKLIGFADFVNLRALDFLKEMRFVFWEITTFKDNQSNKFLYSTECTVIIKDFIQF